MTAFDRAQRKLRSTDGVSLLYALMLFLVAAVVSGVILSAALTSVKVVHSDAAHTQAQLSLDSAARLVADQLEDFSVSVTGSAENPQFSLKGAGTAKGMVRLALDSFQEAYVNQAGLYSATNPVASRTVTLTASDSRIAPVTAVLYAYPAIANGIGDVQAKSYDIRIDLTLQDKARSYSESVVLTQSTISEAGGIVFAWTPSIQSR